MKYTVVCQVCVQLGRDKTVHLLGRPGKSCAEHRAYSKNQRCYWGHQKKRVAAKARYRSADRAAYNQRARERHQLLREEINRRRRDLKAAKKAAGGRAG